MYIVPLASLPSIEPIGESPQRGTQAASDGIAIPFTQVLRQAMDTLEESRQAAETDAYQLAMGDVSSLHSMMINSAMEATAVETVVQLTSRAVSAYKEIMQMQI